MLNHRMLPLLLVLLLWCAACGGHGAADVAPGGAASAPGVPTPPALAGLAGLPAPSTLPRTASGPPVDFQRGRWGMEAQFGLPSNQYSSGAFYPNWAPSGSHALTSAAYATFRFDNTAGYAGQKRVYLHWTTSPAAGDTYVGLANFAKDRWDWFPVDAAFNAHVPSWAPYSGPQEQLLVCVLLLGTAQCSLDYLIYGDSYIRQAALETDLDPDKTKNIGPLSVELLSFKSDSWGAPISHYDWDFDGDGQWDETNDADPYATHLYQPGNWTAKVRVTNTDGKSDTRDLSFLIIDPNNQPPNAFFDATVTSGNAPLQSYLNAQLALDPDGVIIKYEWDFDGDGKYEADLGSEFDVVHVFGRKGVTTVSLRVTDDNLATDTYSVDFDLLHGWSSLVVDAAANIAEPVSMAVIGTSIQRACVAYQDYDSKDLRFAKAATANGSSWNNWTAPVGPAGQTGYSPSMATTLSGAPLIAYGRLDDVTFAPSQYVVGAVDGAASAWNNPMQVAPGVSAGDESKLIISNTVPAIAAVVDSSQSVSHIEYFLAQNADGTSWNAGYTAVAAAPGIIYSYLELGLAGAGAFKYPAVAYGRSGSNFYDTGYACASDIDGTTWNTPYYFTSYSSFTYSLLLLDGKPALMIGNPYQNGDAYFVRANDSTGATWPEPAQIGGGGWGRLVLLNNRPVACYFDNEGYDLYFVGAQDAQGTAWNPPYQVDSVGWVGLYCDMAVANGDPVICYWDMTNHQLKAAYWQ